MDIVKFKITPKTIKVEIRNTNNYVFDFNKASARVLEKAGFTYVAFLKDHFKKGETKPDTRIFTGSCAPSRSSYKLPKASILPRAMMIALSI